MAQQEGWLDDVRKFGGVCWFIFMCFYTLHNDQYCYEICLFKHATKVI